ncbi:DUF2877 domain-containing protein [Caballeronia sordidicola]|uniref:DUF2877 domain-containing protein n=1 Tax=Caballeronia sordidicola TaxID=196367 RepID=UPI0004D00289|nr:DUF2877 domain-containing protein [Caballeronia sordidicola]
MARLLTFPVCSVGYMAEHGPRETQRFWVHSCFQHAMNMSSASGELLTLLSPRYQNLPTAIRLATPPGWDWRHQAHSREPITLENNELRGTLWRANLDRAPCWRPGTERVQGGHSPNALLTAYPLLASQLLEYCMEREVRSSLQLLPGWPPGGRIPRLNPGDAKPELESGVSELIGYGAGLTPDGDDYLLGYLASLWPWQHLGVISAHLKLLRPVIKSQLHRTTSISRHYLALALQGHYSQSIDHLTSVLIHGSTPAEVKLSAINVMKFGSSSGADCLGGFLHGIRALGKVQLKEMN